MTSSSPLSSLQVSLYEAGYVTLSSTKTQARQVAFLAEVVLSLSSLNTFFSERWQEDVARPGTRAELERLNRRLNIFCQENFCGKREDWSVVLHR